MKKIWISLSEVESRLLIHALNEMRTQFIREGRYTDVVDEVILKITNAPFKKVKNA